MGPVPVFRSSKQKRQLAPAADWGKPSLRLRAVPAGLTLNCHSYYTPGVKVIPPKTVGTGRAPLPSVGPGPPLKRPHPLSSISAVAPVYDRRGGGPSPACIDASPWHTADMLPTEEAETRLGINFQY